MLMQLNVLWSLCGNCSLCSHLDKQFAAEKVEYSRHRLCLCWSILSVYPSNSWFAKIGSVLIKTKRTEDQTYLLPSSFPAFYASIFASISVSSLNFARRFFFKFSRNTQVISASFQEAHSRINAKPCSGSATVTTLTV